MVLISSVTITNADGSALNGWTSEFDLPETITDIRNASIVSHVVNRYVFRNAPWNTVVADSATVSFGLQASGGTPYITCLSFILNGTTISGGSPSPLLPTLLIVDASVTKIGVMTVDKKFAIALSSTSAQIVT